MKILLYFSGKLYEPKGTPIRVQNIMNQLIKNHADVYYAGHDMPKRLGSEKILRLGANLFRPFQLAGFVRKNKIDIVYLQTSAGLWLVPFLRILTGAKCGADFHSLLLEEELAYGSFNKVQFFIYQKLEMLLCGFLNFATGVSRPLRDFYGSSIRNFHILPGGVDMKLFNSDVSADPELSSWKAGDILIGYAGNTKWYQGVDVLLEAFSEIHSAGDHRFRLLIISSSASPWIDEFLAKNNLEGFVRHIGKQPHDKIPELLAAADILAIPRPSDRITEFAFPSKFPEYAALGKALIVSDIGDISDYIESDKSGILVKPHDARSLADALRFLADNKVRKSLGEAASDMARRRLDIDILGKNLFNYLNLL